MTSSDWEKIEAAFQEALNLSDEAREEFLIAFVLEYPDLGSRLRDLLAADAQDDDQLLAPIASSVKTLARDTVDPWIGKALGAWIIRKRIAIGGMGAVFLGERDDKQFQQRVAIKIMSSQLLALDAVARFKAERQILANLNHRYIAQLHDGGTTEDGLPYLVMEFVDGLPLDVHCDKHKLNIDQRLALFRKVCDAVDYAHRNLTVHRDLKPSNILIDEHGDPKLLDFGIAKLLDARSANVTIAMTRQGARAMTPEYASPEQVRGEPVSVSTDVYSLGVLLYRLMTGQSPYGSMVSSPLEYERAIVEYDPRRPSTVITSPDGDDEEVGARRDTSAKQLRNRLSGDLDNIALKTLQKDPERRYLTVGALSADVYRYLRNEPVEARGDDWVYKTRKFIVRNSRGLAITGLVLASIATLVSYYTFRLADERDRANLAAAESNEVSTFLTELFESASPFESQGEAITAVDLLEEGRNQIEQLDSQPLLQAELYRIMGSSFTALGHTDQSISMLEEALALKEAADQQDPLSIAETLHNLSEAERQHGENDAAESNLRRALAIREAAEGTNSDVVAYTKARLGVVLFDRGRTEEGLSYLREALAIKAALGTADDSISIDIRGNMANSLDSLGRYDEAIALFEETIALAKQVDGELHPNTIIKMGNMALTTTRLGQHQQAVALLSDALELGYQVWPDTHDQLAFMHGAKGGNLKRLGRLDEALTEYETAADITRRGIGEDNTKFVARLRGVASTLMEMQRFDEADAMYGRALELAIELDGDASANATYLRVLLGRSKVDQSQYAEAEVILRQALQSADRIGKAAALVANNQLAVSLSAQGRFAEAEALFLETLAEKEATNGLVSPTLLGFLKEIAAHYRRTGELDKSIEYAERGNAVAHSDAAAGSWSGAKTIAGYAHTLNALNRREEAQQVYKEAHAALLALLGPDDPRVRELAEQIQ